MSCLPSVRWGSAPRPSGPRGSAACRLDANHQTRSVRPCGVTAAGRPALILVGGWLALCSAASPADAQPDPDFLFGEPGHSISIQGQLSVPRAESELFAFVTEELTLDKADFRAGGLAVDVGFAAGPRVAFRVGLDYARTTARSESRAFVGSDGLPIEQSTLFTHADVFASVVLSVVPRGRQVGQYAWIPRAVVPFVGAGAGVLWSRFQQDGEFIDSRDLSIFADTFESSGWTPSVHGLAGVDIRLTPSLFLTGQARYVWADDELSLDFADFDPIDLAGLRVAAGLRYVF